MAPRGGGDATGGRRDQGRQVEGWLLGAEGLGQEAEH